ncbi:TIGR00730 family Rossman fold protein [Maribellus comscasis]|uniref:Cytokinin riboside 5'-monophosphate phosphoribohydrolase n=1 Tax=Maribellus comscasis TaxID=2681766 RepID=A0A6I6JPM0_9BACT|nr:TIGR00730 family Rossman fold protein [Maribellus comscasis]QGY42998.1 TIGR00730 family Rossman fold protein [Maribellus comscasis]
MNICVFSSSSNAISDVYFQEAEKLGKLIGEGGHTLINGGANVGLMEATTIAAKKAGAKTVGIIPERLNGYSLTSDNAHEVIVTADMQERKAKMREISDAFVAMPGGFGTLEEILEVITLRQLSYHTKPIVFLNTNNFYKYLIKQFETSYSEMFAREINRKSFYVAKTAEEVIDYLINYIPVELDRKWFVVPKKEV